MFWVKYKLHDSVDHPSKMRSNKGKREVNLNIFPQISPKSKKRSFNLHVETIPRVSDPVLQISMGFIKSRYQKISTNIK